MDDLVKRLRDVQIHTIPVDLDTLTNEAAAALEAKDAELARLTRALDKTADDFREAADAVEAKEAELARLREGLQQAYEALLWCAREGRMASPLLHQYPAKWAAEARAALQAKE